MTVDLWMAGDFEEASRIARAYCDKIGLCVTVTPTRFVYRGGEEDGFRIGLRNYPRFPSDNSTELLAHAERIGRQIAEALDQGSFLIEEVGHATYWLTRREGDFHADPG